jgi:DNA-binding NtrC family response regulator/tetratricopeptide (TPR) repeat protein
LSGVADRLEHPAFAPVAGRSVDDAACTDRAKLAVLLQAAAALSVCDAAGWSLAGGWEGAAVDGGGRLSGLVAQPGRDSRPAQEQLRELLLRLFRAKARVAGRGEGRSAARGLLTAWEGALSPMSADEAIGRIFAAAEYLWEPEFGFARAALCGVVVREGVQHLRSAGPAAVRQRLLEPVPRDAPAGSDPDALQQAGTLFARGRFEHARSLLAGREDSAALAIRGACCLLLGELSAAREAVHALAARELSAAERIEAGDMALRVLALCGEPDAAADWAAAALSRARSPESRALAHLLAATAALDRGDRAGAARHFAQAGAEAANPRVARHWHEACVWRALCESDGAAVVEHSRALFAARRALRRFEAGRAWNNLGLGHLTLGNYARAERSFQHSARLLRRCDGPLAITLAQWNLAEVRLRSGKLLEVEGILRAAMAHNRRSGNRRGLTVDEALWLRLELVRGRPQAAVERCTQWLAEQSRLGLDYHRPQLAVLAARACGWLERPGEAADWLEWVDAAGLGELEAEELPGLFALAGRVDEARRRARAGPFAALWLPVLGGSPPPAGAFPPLGPSGATPLTAGAAALSDSAAALAALPAFRRARLLLDVELALPGAVPRAHREAAAELFRRLGASRYAAVLVRGEAGQWTALGEYLKCAPGDRAALADLLRAVGAPECEVVWSSPSGDRCWVEGSRAGQASEEILAEGAGGTLRLRSTRIDEVLRAIFALLLRELPDLSDLRLAVRRGDDPQADAAAADASGLVGESPLLAAALERLRQFAPSDMPVLLLGESGSGKELAAREIRRASGRAGGPWVPVNCAALSETLLLSDLFGHARGAFTGADRARAGVFETANGGTVFLDEIGDLPPVAQGNLLRVLQEGEVRRLGESTARRVDVRLVAATHRDLARMVSDGKFRQDLYYRLKVCTVTLPPLRERGDDAMLLAEHFLAAERRRRSLPQLHLAADARRALQAHRWPGNVRELANVLQAAAALAGNGPIRASMLDLDRPAGAEMGDGASAYHQELDDFRRALLRKALRATTGNRAAAARRLGLSRQALSYLVLHLGLDAETAGVEGD